MSCLVPQSCSRRLCRVVRIYSVGLMLPTTALMTMVYIRMGFMSALPLGMACLVLLWAVVFLPQLYYDSISYTRHSHWLLVEKGIIMRTAALIPSGQIQYLAVSRTLVERISGVCTLSLVTSAGRVRLPGLEPAEAARLRMLMEGRYGK